MSKRIYLVGSSDPAITTRLVLASTPSQAVAHVAKQLLDVKIASQTDLVTHITNGVLVESINGESK
jgi:hypothetical protein